MKFSVIKNSLGLITQALSTLNIDISKMAGLSVEQHDTTQGPESSLNVYPIGHQSGAFATTERLQMQPLNGFGLDGFDMSPETLDAFSYLEPMNATVGALSDFD
jgi:hypothetical protein